MHFKKKCNIDTFVVDLVNHMLVDSVLIANQKVHFIRQQNEILIPNKYNEANDFVISDAG